METIKEIKKDATVDRKRKLDLAKEGPIDKSAKVLANDADAENCIKKIKNLVGHHHEQRKQLLNQLIKNVNLLATELEDDYNAAKENLQRVQNVTEGLIKHLQNATDVIVNNMQQVTATFKQKLESIEELQALCQARYHEIEVAQVAETNMMCEEINRDLHNLEEKFEKAYRKKSWDNLHRSVMDLMKNENI